MIGELLRRTQPRDRWQLAFIDILPELVQEVSLRHHHLLLLASVFKGKRFQLPVLRISCIRNKGRIVKHALLFTKLFIARLTTAVKRRLDLLNALPIARDHGTMLLRDLRVFLIWQRLLALFYLLCERINLLLHA